ncbi:polysialyltransferase family glycosyltransferase [Anaeromassilibacillus sp. An200]|uniref:polysialyltransferase family glycosyltransferase n=1 Tax=Anaeromassilibacillus sp. An200 TaxID=1965587 RepID=UPI000B393B1B|nr:polysialyltransferase family glycosyltransferase [Anaeromassilibacillus sp. An200]OUP05680.1 hypothetical protein B5F35_16655 [Anaeromassilibacillus sp. An200]
MSSKRIIYLCPTLISLMNSIITQLTLNKGIPADIVFENTMDFSEISERLMKYPIFEKCFHWNSLEEKSIYHDLTQHEKLQVSHRPSKIFHIPRLNDQYTDLCVHIDSYAAKFFYYSLIEKGMNPDIHFVSEGTGTYALDFVNTARDSIDHEYYKHKAFLKKVKNVYIYQPQLFTGNRKIVNLVEIPLFSSLDSSIHKMINEIFGKAKPVEEKLIFFEGVFWGDNYLVNEMDLFLEIADYIGKENIVVKRHPRNKVDRFTPMGFHVMEQQYLPWEIMIKDIDLSKKVLVSVASFTAFSAKEMYGRVSRSILLEDLLLGKAQFLEDPGYKRFFQRAEKLFNQDEMVSWRPKSMRELQIVLDILEEKVGGWGK